ncbi:hypothetical protein GCM10008022_41840 [Paenibacillus hunanensis]|nr:hypothetical protein GCM10008022_41840 [Paenibacillus hunanensis]
MLYAVQSPDFQSVKDNPIKIARSARQATERDASGYLLTILPNSYITHSLTNHTQLQSTTL